MNTQKPSRFLPGSILRLLLAAPAAAWAQDSAPRMKAVEFGCPLEIGGVSVAPGDLIFGDRDGGVVIPKEAVGDVVEKASAKASAEKTVRKAIEGGMTSTEAFRKHGVL